MVMGMGDEEAGTAQTELRPNSVLGLNVGARGKLRLATSLKIEVGNLTEN